MTESESPTTWPWFPVLDPVGPADPALLAEGVVARTQQLAGDLLAPSASRSDVEGVPRSHLDALAAVGALGPVQAPAVQRELAETIAGSCGTTWFCWTQHRAPTEWINQTYNETLHARWAEPLSAGKALAGVSFAHVRRPGPATVVAERMTGGWELTGELDWVTSWTIADVIAIVAEVDDGRLVRVVVEPKRRDGLLADVPLELAAMGGTHTCPVQVRRLQVPDIDVISVIDKVRWSELDSFGTRNAGAHMFGVTRAAIALLQQTGEQRDHEPSLELAAALVDRVRTIRREAYSLIDDAEPGDYTEDRVRLRAQALDLAIKATTAAVAARAGAAIRLTDPAQRFAREALFYLVQAQTLETRTASLTELQRSLQQH